MKVLIIRFSSIGDVTQALSIPGFIKMNSPKTEIHFATRSDFAELADNNPSISKVWGLDKKMGFNGLMTLVSELRNERFTHIYDAHNNLRSFIIRSLIFGPKKLVRPMERFKRFLLLQFHINRFEMPFSGQRDLLKPLEKWNLKFQLPPAPQMFLSNAVNDEAQKILQLHQVKNFIALVPSATYDLKRWPMTHWQKLVQLNPSLQFVVLAGPTDHFTHSLDVFKNVVNLTGKTSLQLSASLVGKAAAVVSNDTGLLHMAEQLGRPAIALMGPAPFGFPSRPSTQILERDLACRPCSKHGQGPCVNPNFHECLNSISPEEVSQHLRKLGL